MRDLPVPDWLFFWGGAVVLVLSFLALGALWKTPQLERRRAGRPLPAALERFLRSRRPARDPRRRLGRAARRRLPDRAHRGAVLGGEPLADLHLRDLLARDRPAAGVVRKRLARAESMARRRERGRVDLAEARAGLDAAARVSEAARHLAGGLLPPVLRDARALLRGTGEPACAGARDRALQLRDVVRDGRVRPAGVGRAREWLHRLLRPARTDRAVRRARGPARLANAVLRPRPAARHGRARSRSSR